MVKGRRPEVTSIGILRTSELIRSPGAEVIDTHHSPGERRLARQSEGSLRAAQIHHPPHGPTQRHIWMTEESTETNQMGTAESAYSLKRSGPKDPNHLL